MKLRHALVSAFALALATGSAIGLSLPSSPELGPYTSFFGGGFPSPYVASNASVAGLHPGLKTVRVGGSATPGDGGEHIKIYDPSNACGAGGHPAASTAAAPTTCINSAYGGAPAGSWDIDWASVGGIARPQLVGFKGGGSATSIADTAAVQAMANTGYPLGLDKPGSKGNVWVPSTCVTLTTQGQEVFGAKPYAVASTELRIQVLSNAPLASSGATAPACGNLTNPGIFDYIGPPAPTSSEPGPHFHDIGAFFAQPGPGQGDDDIVNYFNYPPLISAVGAARVKMERVGCYNASVCFDFRGNAGGLIAIDTECNVAKTGMDATGTAGIYNTGINARSGICWRVDGALDTMRWVAPHFFPWTSSINQQTLAQAQDSSRVIGFQLGRCDGCYVTQMMNIIGLSAWMGNGIYGNTAGTSGFYAFSDSDIDSTSGFVTAQGNVKLTGNDYNILYPNAQALVNTGATVTVSGGSMQGAGSTALPLISTSGANTQAATTIISGLSYGSALDTIAIQVSGGTTVISNFVSSRTGNKKWTNPTILNSGGANSNMTLCGSRETQPAQSGGTFVQTTDGHNNVNGNTAIYLGWNMSVGGSAMQSSLALTSGGGLYFGNN